MLEFEIKETNFYGSINSNYISLDDKDYFNNSLILMKLYIIKCFISNDKSILGMQIKYRGRELQDKNKEYQTINFKINNNYQEQEFILEKEESIINITLWKDEYINGFEIITNFGRKFLFGKNCGNKIMLNEFSSNYNILVGFFSKFDIQIGLIGLGFYYVSHKEYLFLLYSGIFYLRAKLNDKNFYKSIMNKKDNLDLINKAILNLGMLPKNLFLIIMKYLIK